MENPLIACLFSPQREVYQILSGVDRLAIWNFALLNIDIREVSQNTYYWKIIEEYFPAGFTVKTFVASSNRFAIGAGILLAFLFGQGIKNVFVKSKVIVLFTMAIDRSMNAKKDFKTRQRNGKRFSKVKRR